MKRGNCYVTCEALYHLLGGRKAGWKPMRVKVGNETHWFLLVDIGIGGIIIDPTANQFRGKPKPDYSKAIGSGFLTKKPSRRAKELMHRLLWQST